MNIEQIKAAIKKVQAAEPIVMRMDETPQKIRSAINDTLKEQPNQTAIVERTEGTLVLWNNSNVMSTPVSEELIHKFLGHQCSVCWEDNTEALMCPVCYSKMCVSCVVCVHAENVKRGVQAITCGECRHMLVTDDMFTIASIVTSLVREDNMSPWLRDDFDSDDEDFVDFEIIPSLSTFHEVVFIVRDIERQGLLVRESTYFKLMEAASRVAESDTERETLELLIFSSIILDVEM